MTAVLPAKKNRRATRSNVPAQTSSSRRFSPLSLFEALATPHGVDRYLELVNPMLTVREMRAEVVDVRRSTGDTVTLTLRPTRHWRGFQAGQFVQITVEIDGVRRTRCYSPACSALRSDGRIEITIKAHPQGLVSQHLHANVAPGLVLGLSQAAGTFRLPDIRPGKVLLVSGGSGITPVLSMLRTLCDEGYRGDISFLHYGYTESDVSYRDDLRAIADAHPNVRLMLAYTDQQTFGDLHGFFGQEHLDAAAPWHADEDAQTFLCGPAPLMASVRAVFDANGISDRLHTEDFAPAPFVADEGQATGTITFNRSVATAANSGSTLLEQAEAAGLTPEFGCRMGICFSCTQVKTSGCTRNVRSGELDSDPDVEVQLCINVPVGDVALDI
ncbi:MAG: ferredoxin reductase [Actinomycetota bacterium]|nr:ferredoxin reductase [Actinomycetota bacterium]